LLGNAAASLTNYHQNWEKDDNYLPHLKYFSPPGYVGLATFLIGRSHESKKFEKHCFIYYRRDDADTKIVLRILRCVRKPCSHTAPQNFWKKKWCYDRPQNPSPSTAGGFASRPPIRLNDYRLENVQDPTSIESTGRCICWANLGAKRNLYFILSAPLFQNIPVPQA